MSATVKTVSAEESRIQAELVNAAVAHHNVFGTAIAVNSQNALRWEQSATAAKDLSNSLAELHELTKSAVQEGQLWRQERVVTSAAVAHHQKIVEILDIPQTLDVCLRNEMFHEALLILDYVRNLMSERGDRSVRILDQLGTNITKTLSVGLQSVVIPRLSQSLPLNTAVKLVTFLRRLRTEEDVLTTLFLECKTTFLDQCMQEAVSLSHTPYSFLSKLLNVYKVQVAEVVNQFKACFPTAALSELASWCSDRAARFLTLFESKLQLVTNGAEVSSLMDQTGNVCSAAVRVGMDIGPLLMESLCNRVQQLFSAQLNGAASAFRAAMQSISWKLPTSMPSQHQGTNDREASSSGPPPAPVSLLPFLPLAYAMNGILSALNEVRKCAAKSVAWFCCEELLAFLRVIVNDIRRAQRSARLMEPHEQESMRLFAKAFVDDVVPHTMLCTRRVFPSAGPMVSQVAFVLADELRGISEMNPKPMATSTASTAPPAASGEQQGSVKGGDAGAASAEGSSSALPVRQETEDVSARKPT